MTTEYTRRAIIVVTAADQAAANTLAAQVDPVGGAQTFRVGLVSAANPTGPITHYWCAWNMTQAQWDTLWASFGDGSPYGRRMYDGAVWLPADVLTDMGLAIPPFE